MAYRKLASIFCFIAPIVLSAQQTLPTEKVDVIKDFEVRLKDSEKKNFQPELPVIKSSIVPQTYDVTAKPIQVEYAPPAIRPLAIKKESDPTQYGSFIKIGGMLPTGFEGNLGIGKSSEDYSIGFVAHHLQMNNDSKIENQKNSWTEGKLFGTYFTGPIAIKGHLGYTIERLHYYGYQFRTVGDSAVITNFPSEQVFQSFQTLNGALSVSNAKENDLKIDYGLSTDFYHLKDNYAAKEQGLAFTGFIEKWLAQKHSIDLALEGAMIQYKDTSNQGLNYINITPTFAFRHQIFKVIVGANIIPNQDEVKIFPSLKLAAQVIPKGLILELGANGQRTAENLRSLTTYNPFIKTRIQLRPNDLFTVYTRAHGSIGKITYEGAVSYQTESALPLFNLVAGEVIPRFNVQFDTVKTFMIMAKGSMPIQENFTLTGKLISRTFDARNHDAAWHRVGIEIQGGVSYASNNQKLLASLHLNQYSRIAYLKGGLERAYLLPILELSAEVEYQISPRVSAYLAINNLTGNENARWLYYNRYGMNPNLGLVAKF
jgi:hypothetical protein